MRRDPRPASALFALVLFAGCATNRPVPSAPKAPAAPVALNEYFKILRVGAASFSFDEKLVAYISNQGGRLDIWVQPAAGGEPWQISKASGMIHSLAFSPVKDQLLFEEDQGGNELPHIYLTDSMGQQPRDLMAKDPAHARTQFVRWADDGKSFLYLCNRRDPKFLDLYEYTLKSNKSELLWQSSGKLAFGLTSKDHKSFVLIETLSDVDSNLYLLQRGKKQPTLLTQHDGEINYLPTAFSKDAKALFYASDDGAEFSALYSMDVKSKKSTQVLKADWDVEDGHFSETFAYFVTETNADGKPQVVITDQAKKQPVTLPDIGLPQAVLVPRVFSKTDRYLAAALVTDSAPTTLYVVDLKENKATRLIEPLPESLRSRPMIASSSVRIPSFDGKEVPALLYRPAGNGPFPAVIKVHGGPTAQSLVRFDRLSQYLVSKGYLVLVPNVRGSTGYGKSYTKLDNLDLGGGPLQDVVACKRWLVANAKAFPDRIVVMGGSYGGYMALAAAAFTPGEFGALVDYFGPSDLKSLVESFPPYWAAFATAIYKKFGDPANPEHAQYQHDRSPLYFADKIQKPLLVVQGQNDARVKQDQSDRIVAELQKRKVPVHYLVLPGEGHGFSQIESELAAYQATDRFLDRYIWGDTAVDVIKPLAAAATAPAPDAGSQPATKPDARAPDSAPAATPTSAPAAPAAAPDAAASVAPSSQPAPSAP